MKALLSGHSCSEYAKRAVLGTLSHDLIRNAEGWRSKLQDSPWPTFPGPGCYGSAQSMGLFLSIRGIPHQLSSPTLSQVGPTWLCPVPWEAAVSTSSSFPEESLWSWGWGWQYNFEVVIVSPPSLYPPQLDPARWNSGDSLTSNDPDNGLMQLPSQ